MRIITLHSDSLEVEAKEKALKDAEKIDKNIQEFGESLVVLTAVEKTDEGSEDSISRSTADAIRKVAKDVKVDSIVLYPYVHLTSNPSLPSTAKKIMSLIEEHLRKNFEVAHAPFGWYKSFTISVKGHPLAELSREISPQAGKPKDEDDVTGALKDEEKVKSTWHILTSDGKLNDPKKFDFKKYPNLKKFYDYETSKVRGVSAEPPHARLMRQLELADYEPGSDPGNLKWLPKGRLMKSLLEMWVTSKVIDYGAVEVETPIMYDFEHPALQSYLQRFPARQYVVRSAKKEFFLRFSACFGQFLTAAASTLSYRALPFKIYELAHSFRLEKAGELVALRRLRAFTMPDMHTMCRDFGQAKEEFQNQYKLCMDLLKDLNFYPQDHETAIRFTEEFYEKNKDFVTGLVKLVGKPALIEMWNFRYAYFDPKFEFNFVDSTDKASALSTVQIDHENGERFNIRYTDKDNTRKHPLILHCSPPGAIERVVYAMLERAHMDSENKKNPVFPLWLSPTQVRFCPVNDSFVKYCEELADKFTASHIRADVDDNVESIQKKVRSAEMEWIPYIVVVGEKEKSSGKLAVRLRENGKVEQISADDLMKTISKQTAGYPFKKLSLPRLLSMRPSFS